MGFLDFFVIILLLPDLTLAVELKFSGQGQAPQATQSHFPLSSWQKMMDDQNNRIYKKYQCTGLQQDPSVRAKQLITLFSLPRTSQQAIYQGFCFDEAQNTISVLKNKNGALAQSLSLKLKEIQGELQVQAAFDSCPGGSTPLRSRVGKLLQTAEPLPLFRTLPVPAPPPLDKAVDSLRGAIYSESMSLAVDRSVFIAKTHGLATTDLIDKICPPQSTCDGDHNGRNLRTYLKTEFYNAVKTPIERKSDSQVYSALQNAVSRLDKAAKKFNSTLKCHKTGTSGGTGAVVEGSHEICDSTLASDDSQLQQSRAYYDEVEDILSSNEGSLLGHEPFKYDLRSVYNGIPMQVGGKTVYAFEQKYNDPPGFDSFNNRDDFQRLPDSLRLLGGGFFGQQRSRKCPIQYCEVRRYPYKD